MRPRAMPPEQRSTARRWQRLQAKDTPLVIDTPHARAAQASGGILLEFRFKPTTGENGGCGSPTHVEGTNGGTMPCGSILHRFGVAAPYYCAACDTQRKAIASA